MFVRTVVINRPLDQVLARLAEAGVREKAADGGYSFERIGGTTRITFVGPLSEDFTGMMIALLDCLAGEQALA